MSYIMKSATPSGIREKGGNMSYAGGSPGAKPPTRTGILRKILVIDRDEYWGPAVSLALEEIGYYLNWVKEPGEGRRRAFERVYDLVILSDSLGEPAVHSILEALSGHLRRPSVIVMTGAEATKGREPSCGGARCSILRRPCKVEDVVDAVRSLVGVPWSDRRGA
jgi:DNA-binding response OmpR family regulator